MIEPKTRSDLELGLQLVPVDDEDAPGFIDIDDPDLIILDDDGECD